MAVAVILMGVSGCGKTSVGERLSDDLGWPFYDGDDFHPQGNIDKMAQGVPLNDDDRRPWLEGLHALIVEEFDQGNSLIVASSALKAKYRQILKGEREDVYFVHLSGSFELIFERMQQRSGHYMKAEMLRSQFADLEPPQHALTISIDQPVNGIVTEIIEKLKFTGEPK
ncbi:MAG TPA: gluconokinase [Anaerolineales bacterium]|nr:gluconokinase [Anaerolineales bacterium]